MRLQSKFLGRLVLLCSVVAGLAPLGALAQFGGALNNRSNTTVEMSLDAAEVRPGETVTAAIRLHSTDGWHTYWRNSGDDGTGGPVGQATRIDWTLPKGVSAGAIQWPAPRKFVEKDFHTHILEDATLLVPLTIESNTVAGPLTLQAKVRWLECKEECVPGQATVSSVVQITGQRKPSPAAAEIEKARSKIPVKAPPGEAKVHWEGNPGGDSRAIVIEWSNPAASAGFEFFAFEKTGEIRARTEAVTGDGPKRIRKLVAKSEAGWPARIHGVLAATGAANGGIAIEVDLPIEPPPSGSVAKRTEPISLKLLLPMLGFAFLGGLILNIMPCVLPVLALKILSFVNQAKKSPAYVRQLGLIYGLGVVVSFIFLASLALLVQKAGGVAGWSTAFQNPHFRVGITILITLVSLNLFGLFEVTLHPTASETAFVYASKEGPAGAFFNGVLAAVLATPCTAPFLGAAIGFAFTQPPLVLLLFFVTAGIGLALPFVLLCWKPAWLKLMPKPGHWMVRFKMAMGFPMLGTAVWLFWFTATRMGEAGVLWFGLALVTIAAAFWVWGEFVQRGTSRRGFAIATAVGLVGVALFGLLPLAGKKSKIVWQKWSPEAVARAQAEGKPVIVDFTADNCLNCKFNKSTSIEIDSTVKKITEIGAVPLIGDFTDADPAIANELARYGRRGVPLVLVYPKYPGKDPKVLPTVLTPALVHEALQWSTAP